MDENKIFSVYTPKGDLIYQEPTIMWRDGELPDDDEIRKLHIQRMVHETMSPFMFDIFMKYMKPKII